MTFVVIELRAAVSDAERWQPEARAAAYQELLRRGVTDVPDPETTVFRHVGAKDKDSAASGRLWYLIFVVLVTLPFFRDCLFKSQP